MDAEAKYWKDKWTEAQKQIESLKQILKDEFECVDGRLSNELRREEKKYGKPRTKQTTRFL